MGNRWVQIIFQKSFLTNEWMQNKQRYFAYLATLTSLVAQLVQFAVETERQYLLKVHAQSEQLSASVVPCACTG